MTEQQIINEFFQDQETAVSYVRNRLLGNFDEAPPPIGDRFVEEFPTDFLQHLVEALEDKTIFWNACFQLFKDWRDPEKADHESARGLGELIYMIRQFNHSHEEMFSQEKDRWEKALKPRDLTGTLYNIEEKDLVYTQNLSLVHIWNLWQPEQWLKLYENILESTDTNNETQYEIMLITIQHLEWNVTKTRNLFLWTLNQDNLPKTFYNQFFFHRLCLCGNRMTGTEPEEQKTCQHRLVDDMLEVLHQLLNHDNKDQIRTLGKFLRESCKLFDLQSFKCLDQKKKILLEKAIEKLDNPPPVDKTPHLF